jgi:methyl-accepting chemotaxis protein
MKPAAKLRTTAELTNALDALQNAEADVTASLAALLANSEPITAALKRLNGLTSRWDEMGQDAKLLHANVERTAKTAERVGGKVKALDEEMRRVREASERVGMVMELKVKFHTY